MARKPGLRRPLVWLAVFALFFSCAGCASSGDGPPMKDGPEPAAHRGTFRDRDSSLFFHGDGETLDLSLDGAMNELLPAGEAQYQFCWENRGSCRYDVASRLKVFRGEALWEFKVVEATEQKLILRYFLPNDSVEFNFLKADAED